LCGVNLFSEMSIYSIISPDDVKKPFYLVLTL